MKKETENKSKVLSNIRENWKFFVLIFLIGVAYADSKAFLKDFTNLSDRVDKKIQVQNEIREDIMQLLIQQAVEKETAKYTDYRIKQLEKNNSDGR